MFLFGIYNVTRWEKKARSKNVRFYLASTGSTVALLLFIGGDGVKPTAPFMDSATFFEV